MIIAGYFNRALNQMLWLQPGPWPERSQVGIGLEHFYSVLFLLETDMLTPAEQCALVVATALAVTALTNNRSCKST